MKKIIIDSAFWQLFPEAQISVLVVNGLSNHVEEDQTGHFVDLLHYGKKEAEKFLTEEHFSQNEVIKEWREAFSKFKTKKGARSSIEALLKRVSQDRDFYPINPLVDIYNSISMKYGLPCGGEDIDCISGNLHLGKAKGGESFFPLGAEKDAPALAEEIIYHDDEGAVCRCLNWREAQRTMLTENTKNAVLVIESIHTPQANRANEALNELKQLIDSYFNVSSVVTTLNSENASCSL